MLQHDSLDQNVVAAPSLAEVSLCLLFRVVSLQQSYSLAVVAEDIEFEALQYFGVLVPLDHLVLDSHVPLFPIFASSNHLLLFSPHSVVASTEF